MNIATRLLSLLFVLAMAGCGGPSGDQEPPVSDDDIVIEAGINMQIFSLQSGEQTNSISTEDTAVVGIQLVDDNGVAVEDEIVAFNVSVGSATLSQSSVLTDSNGRASIRMFSSQLPVNTSEPGIVNASSEGYESKSLVFQFVSSNSTGSTLPELGLQMALTSSGEQGNRISTTDSAQITVSLSDGSGNPIPDEIINLSATSGVLTQESLLTDVNGSFVVTLEAPTTLLQGTAPGVLTATPASGATEPKSITYEFVASTNGEPDDTSSVGTIKFISSIPEIISLKGTGGAGFSEVSQVKFLVSDSNDLPIQGVEVSFNLTTTVGGLSLTESSAITASNGVATAFVNSGTIATPVRVTASVMIGETPVFVQSDQLTLTTGIPDQNSVSLDFSQFAPEGLNYDGETVDVTVRLADRFNNPVPDGTVVNFTSEGGRVDGSCSTLSSECSVLWTSQNPRPADHRATILATVIGHETYYDKNGSGVFDDGDTFDDLPEAFRDDDEVLGYNPSVNNFREQNPSSGSYDFSKDEKYIDYDGSATYSLGDGKYNGIPCNHSSDCASGANNLAGRSDLLTTLSRQNVLIMASSFPRVYVRELVTGSSCLSSSGKVRTDTGCSDSGIGFSTGSDTRLIWVLISDTAAFCVNGSGTRLDAVDPDSNACTIAIRQSAPTDSSISVSTEAGSISSAVQDRIYNTTAPAEFVFSITSDSENEEPISGALSIEVTTPLGNKVYRSISVTDPAG